MKVALARTKFLPPSICSGFSGRVPSLSLPKYADSLALSARWVSIQPQPSRLLYVVHQVVVFHLSMRDTSTWPILPRTPMVSFVSMGCDSDGKRPGMTLVSTDGPPKVG